MIRENPVLKIQIRIILVILIVAGIAIVIAGGMFHVSHTSNKEEATECFKTFVEQVKSNDYAGILATVMDAEEVGLAVKDIEIYINDSGLVNLKNVDLEKELYAVDEGTSNWYGWVFYEGVTYKIYFDKSGDDWKLLLPELTEK